MKNKGALDKASTPAPPPPPPARVRAMKKRLGLVPPKKVLTQAERLQQAHEAFLKREAEDKEKARRLTEIYLRRQAELQARQVFAAPESVEEI